MGSDDDDDNDGPRSAYVIEFSIQPGGARWAELHTYTNLDHVRVILEQFCQRGRLFGPVQSLWMAATLTVRVVQRSIIVTSVHLRPFLRVWPATGAPIPAHSGRTLKRFLDARGEQLRLGPYDYSAPEAEQEVKVELAWAELASQLPALEPPLLMPGESTIVRRRKQAGVPTHLAHGDMLCLGSLDWETGDTYPVPFDLTDA